MSLTERVCIRLSIFEKTQFEKYRMDLSDIARKAWMKKYREFVSDPQLILDEGESGPGAIYIQAWNRIMPGITSLLDKNEFEEIKESEEKLETLKRIVPWALLRNYEIQQLAIFLQGGDLSERILMICVEAHLEQ